MAKEADDLDGLKRRLRDEVRKSTKLEKDLADTVGTKVGGRLRKMWFLRAGLSNPSISGQVLSEFCRDSPIEEAQQISKDYIGTVRNTMCEITKGLNRRGVENSCQDLRGSLFIAHIHDEACLRVRSFSVGWSWEAVLSWALFEGVGTRCDASF